MVGNPKNDRGKKPRVEAADDNLLVYMRLVKLGYGDLKGVEEMNSREVLQALHYESFCDDYEAEHFRLNQKEGD